MLIRTITSIVFVLVIFPIYFFSDTVVLPIAVALLSVIGVYEMLGCIGTRHTWAIAVPAYAAAVVLPPLVRLFSTRYTFLSIYVLVMFGYLMWCLTCGMFSRGRLDLEKVAVSYIGVFYVITGFLSLIWLRDRDYGIYILFMAMFGPWGSDVFCYLCGRLFGRHKLIPDISPKKTVEGAVGGVFFLGIAAIIFGWIVALIDPAITQAAYLPLYVAGLVISVFSQIGDLIASYIKRKYGVKDYGKLLPGHGGILDRFDSVLCVVPAMVILGEIPHIFDYFS